MNRAQRGPGVWGHGPHERMARYMEKHSRLGRVFHCHRKGQARTLAVIGCHGHSLGLAGDITRGSVGPQEKRSGRDKKRMRCDVTVLSIEMVRPSISGCGDLALELNYRFIESPLLDTSDRGFGGPSPTKNAQSAPKRGSNQCISIHTHCLSYPLLFSIQADAMLRYYHPQYIITKMECHRSPANRNTHAALRPTQQSPRHPLWIV
jgi:hypothetical protein